MPIHNDFNGSPSAISAENLAAGGFLLSVEVSPPEDLTRLLTAQVTPVDLTATGFALIDTGASCCCVEDAVLRRLRLQPIRRTAVRIPNGTRLQSVYIARLSFPGSPIPAVEMRVVGVQLDDEQTIALVGRDFLRRCLLVYNGPMGSCTLSF